VSWGKTWTVVLRCYGCANDFLVPHVTIDRVKLLGAICRCPACGARPAIHRSAELRVHRLIDFSDEMETVYRRLKTVELWHFTADCSEWPREEFIELNARPRVGQLCVECLDKSRSDSPTGLRQ
jgi:hypothetical protein